ncbi:MAG: sugar transferase [Microthrixaceae bacterium]
MRSERLAPMGGSAINRGPTLNKSVAYEELTTTSKAEITERPAPVPGSARVPTGPIRPIIGTKSSRIKAALICSDIASVALGAVLSFGLLHKTAAPPTTTELGLITLAAVLAFLLTFAQQGLYNSRHISRRAEELRRMVNAAALGTIGVAALFSFLDSDPDPGALLALCAISLVVSGVGREVLRRIIRSQRVSGRLSRPVILVGSNREARELHEMLSDSSELGYDVVGRVSDNLAGESLDSMDNGEHQGGSGWDSSSPWLGTTDNILDIVRSSGATGVVVATTDIDLETANRLVRTLTNEGIYVEMSSAMRDIATRRVTIRPLGRYPVMSVEPAENNGWRSTFKRCFDIILSCMILMVLSPLLIAAMLAIRITSGPGVFFRQVRVGRNGDQFTVFKLRTMVPNAESLLTDLWDQNEAAGPMFKMTNDPRVTRVGRLLRKTSMDEVPQFFNVIRGEMSLVGPRPALPSEAIQWDDDLRERLRVKPGITGNWQVNGRYTSSLEDYQRLDMFYVDNWSLVTDLVIMAKTIPAVLKRNGAA